MMQGNGINYEKCNTSKKIDKQKFFFVFFSLECCITINTTKIMSKPKKTIDFKLLDVDLERDYDNGGYFITGAQLEVSQLKALARYMSYAINRTEKQIERWENHLGNDGQVTYMERIKDLNNELKLFKEIAAIK
jgi:hypothetical protein